jgi:hypothetical protein
MNAKNFLLALLLFNWNTALHAQNPTTCFSGTWRLNLEKSKLQKGTTIQSQTVTITCSGESIQMQYISDGKESKETYTTDGKERKINENQGGEVVVKAKGKGSVLIIETIGHLKIPTDPLINGSDAFHYRERWKLSGDGQVLYVERDELRSVFTYEKASL